MVAGASFVGFVRFSLDVHAFHGVDYFVLLLVFHSVALVVVMLYESPGGNQVDGLPPAPSSAWSRILASSSGPFRGNIG